MPNFPAIVLHNKKAEAVKRFHPWIFSGAIKQKPADLQDGDVVDVVSAAGDYLATGHYAPNNIAVKIFSFTPVESLDALFLQKVQAAYALREQIGLAHHPTTNCYRLINAEGDGLPGLIVDWYNGHAVLQAYSAGMYAQRSRLVQCLQAVYGDRLLTVYDKSEVVFAQAETASGCLLGDAPAAEVLENGHRFWVNWQEGQKTGFFMDQRDHRQLLARYAPGRRVLNTFSYSGGFSVYAAQAGASLVHSVDSSAKAIAWTNQNFALNGLDDFPHTAIAADVFTYLKQSAPHDYDVIILDPPAFAKNISARHQAVMAYKRLNNLAIANLRSPGLLFTFSCSQVVTPDLFKGAVVAGAIEAGRTVRILHQLTQPADHPISIYHPEGLYLKGLVLAVE